jgi:RNA polymerase sigma-70 factor (ECF subfamily)
VGFSTGLTEDVAAFVRGATGEAGFRTTHWTVVLGMSEGALKVAVHRMRQRYGDLLSEKVARTVSSPAEAEEEIRHLISVVGR